MGPSDRDRFCPCLGMPRQGLAAFLAFFAPVCLAATPVESLGDLSLEQLSNLEVTSVSKAAEPLRAAPAAIYVISHDDILRSGVTSIAEALRLAPNLHILQYSATNYIAGARGFAGAQEAQNFSNKLLILIDGRSVYTPLYSGVYLDIQDVLIDDIDRIEVISGPGATLWGANAVNGVINIVTRPAYLTDQPLVSAGFGDRERTASARYGDKIGDALSYRVYGKAFKREAQELESGASALDAWEKAQGGFRVDWTGAADSVTTQGDLYRANQNQPELGDQKVLGANLLARWDHRSSEKSEWRVQGYYDYTQRAQPPGGVAFALRTFDFDAQQSLSAGPNRIVWGGGVRVNRYHITSSETLVFDPDERTLVLGNVFVRDTVGISDRVDLTLGIKLERDPFSGVTPLPDLRLAWRLSDTALLWSAASRAIRSPTPFDHDVVEKVGGAPFLVGNSEFASEKVNAFEIGYRGQPAPSVSVSASVFFIIYDDLRSIETHSDSEFLPLRWGNEIKGNTYGLEAWGKWQATDWWRLSPGLRLLYKDLKFQRGASELLGLAQSGNDPRSQALLTSSMDLGAGVTLDATLRYVGALPDPHLGSYFELGASLGYRISRQFDVSVSGFNLLHARHLEYPDPSGEYIRRSVIAQLRWRY